MTDLFVKIALDDKSSELLDRVIKSMSREELAKGFLALFGKLSLKAAGFIITHYLSGQALKRRTGALAQSIVGDALLRKGLPTMRVGVFKGTASKYAGVQELGTKGFNPSSPFDTIRPVNAKNLAFPVNDALTSAGVSRYGGPRQYPGELKFVPWPNAPKATGALYDKNEWDSAVNIQDIKPLYILIKELDLEPSYYLRDGMLEFLPKIAPELVAFIRGILQGKLT